MKKYILPVVIAFLIGAGLYGLIGDSFAKPVLQRATDPVIAEQVYAKSNGEALSADNIMAATNAQRSSQNLHPLVTNEKLNASACAKLDNMVQDGYWAHDNPNGTTPWSFIEAAGYKYQSAGENLAYGQMSTPEVMEAWMNSPKHKENIVDTKWMEQGVCVKYVSFANNKDVFLMVHHFGVR